MKGTCARNATPRCEEWDDGRPWDPAMLPCAECTARPDMRTEGRGPEMRTDSPIEQIRAQVKAYAPLNNNAWRMEFAAPALVALLAEHDALAAHLAAQQPVIDAVEKWAENLRDRYFVGTSATVEKGLFEAVATLNPTLKEPKPKAKGDLSLPWEAQR